MEAVSREREDDLWLAKVERRLELLDHTKQEEHVAFFARPHHLQPVRVWERWPSPHLFCDDLLVDEHSSLRSNFVDIDLHCLGDTSVGN
jgi:hypothetical protein